jgi:hypothetical protein
MSLTPEQIDMIKRLQPVFKEKMGKWQEGDEYYDTDNKDHGWVEEVMPDYFNNNEFPYLLRIPKPIDWQNPERGLFGMLSSFNSLECYKENRWVCEVAKESIQVASFGSQDPFTALLKALCEQEGM